ncbi:MAG: RNA polymerase sigma factor [Planctomycetota bacterium]
MEPDREKNREELRADIARARRGETDALDRVLVSMEARLRSAAAHKLGAPLRAKMATSDLLQSTYVDVVRSIKSFEGDDPETLVAWITRIMENNVRDRLRFFGRQRRAAEIDQTEPPEVPSEGPTPSFEVMKVEHLAVVGKVLSEMPEEFRRIIQLRQFEQREYEEIATLMGKSTGALRMMLSRAMAMLMTRVDKAIGDP